MEGMVIVLVYGYLIVVSVCLVVNLGVMDYICFGGIIIMVGGEELDLCFNYIVVVVVNIVFVIFIVGVMNVVGDICIF